ncbi:hypothetical protein Scep_005285 [Stephania cephalantha]|uniref:Late embryogenesis abundant protein LEA-2 subgroup domain-containing protein n=1 Tax=Stephania cephalantha TaxID=152367 RepID=A0AAP0PZX9_9MAGN
MANSTVSRPPSLLRLIAIIILVLIILVGLAVLIIWLTVKPRKLEYSIERVDVQGFNLHYDHLNASFDLVMRAYNPNTKAALYYDSINVFVSYDDQNIASQTVQPFFQPHHNVTRLELKPTSQSLTLQGSVSRDLRLEKSSGEIELDVYMRAKVRFKVGRWKSRHYTIKVRCSPVVVHLYSPRKFQSRECDVDL